MSEQAGPSGPAAATQPRWWRPVLRDLVDAFWSWLTTAAGVGAGIAVVDGARTDGLLPVPLAALAVFAGDALVRPALRRLAGLGSAVTALVLGLLGQLVVVVLALRLTPGIVLGSVLDAVGVLLVAAAVMAVGRWLVGAANSAYVLGHLLRRGPSGLRRRPGPRSDGRPGLLVVQLDGVSRTVLRRALDAGEAPVLQRWLETGSHSLGGWWSTVPSTTPASQAGLLHGDDEQVPAFRWWDRRLGRLLVSNRPGDAAVLEQRLSDGTGLLAHDGVAIATMFSGDAETCLLVMSKALARRGLGPGGSFVRFFASPFVLSRAVLLTVSEMVKELYQGHRQVARQVWPRVPRRGAYVLLRGITNALLRDLTLALVAERLVDPVTRVIFVDLVDYDEIAHHAGPERPESRRALEGLDGVLGLLEQVARRSGRPWRTVVLSDHGQSLGPTFAQTEGETLDALVRRLCAVPESSVVQALAGEEWGPVNALLTSARRSGSSGRGRADGVLLGPDRAAAAARPAGDGASQPPELAVSASGNLGMIWFPRLPRRPDLNELETRWPGLLPGLLACASIGLVMVPGPSSEPVVMGPGGVHWLGPGRVDGQDPLAGYPPRGAADLRRLAGLADCGDVVLLSGVDAHDRVRAFEGLVGSHGGLGGLQNDALLIHPADWPLAGELVGPVAVHEQLLVWMRAEGIRPQAPPVPAEASC